MNLRAIANAKIQVINSDLNIIIRLSDGYTLGQGARQIPEYLPDFTAKGQLQAADEEFLKQQDGLNLQSVYRNLYITGNLDGVVRSRLKGGDLIFIENEEWIVVKVIEHWKNWVKVLICLQSQ
jgi:hypothetical protein